MTAPSRPVMRYHGGKWRIAPWIIAHFPPHQTYVELFGGAGSVLIRKPRVKTEVYNDLDREVVNLFSILRDPERAAELRRVISLTPYAREELELSYLYSPDPIERARRLLCRAAMGVGSDSATRAHRTGFRRKTHGRGTHPAADWQGWPEQIERFTDRLRGVIIESCDAVNLLHSMDEPDTLFYIDPPYLHSTRTAVAGRGGNYRHELNDLQHLDLLAAVAAARGMVVLSGYSSPMYEEALAGWQRVEKHARADHGQARLEVLWINPAAARGIP